MNNLRWLTGEELKSKLTQINKTTGIKKSGIPMTYDEENLYIDDKESHSLVIGTTGSGKTQVALLPQARLAVKAGESIVVNDINGEIHESLKTDLEENGYKTILLNLENPSKGNCYNPLKLAYDLYKSGNKDKAMEIIENVGYYLFSERNNNSDPFWENSAINYFTGLTLYLFENATEEEINLNNISKLSADINNDKELMEKVLSNIDNNSAVYANLIGILHAPTETRGSILAVFNQKFKLYVTRENLSNMMSKTDFDITNITNEKTAIFIISGTGTHVNSLIPLIINQIYYIVDIYGNKEKRINIIIDEFGRLNPMKDIINIVNNSRSINIRITVFIMSLLELKNTYGTEITELLKISFGNIIYLLASDIETLEEVSRMCGNIGNNPIITPEELKLLNYFEAIILIPRVLPIKTKLLPDYQIKW